MNITEYTEKRKLDMVKESRELAQKRETLIAQAQQIEANVKAINQRLYRLETELSVLEETEKALTTEGE